jgi:type IV pilus assembly protein PilM
MRSSCASVFAKSTRTQPLLMGEGMDSNTTAWGLDIGFSGIKAVQLQREGSQVMLAGYALQPIEQGGDRDQAVADALQALAAQENLSDAPVIVALSGRQIFTKTINIPVLNAKSIHRMVELEARQQIPGDFNEVSWSYHLSPALDGASYDVALFAARNDIIHQLITTCDNAGIQLAGISVGSLAIYNYVQYDQQFEEDEAVIILDVGAENTDLVVYQGDSLWMRNLGISGNDITRAFQKKFGVPFSEAETLKFQVNESRQAGRILKVFEGVVGELVTEVQRSLGFYKNLNAEAQFESVVVAGHTFRLQVLSEVKADRLGYPIISLVEMERIALSPAIDHDRFLEDVQSLSTATGLALQGIGEAHATVNLLPSQLRLQRILGTKRWAAVAILVIIAVSIAISWFVRDNIAHEHYRRAEQIAGLQSEHLENVAGTKAALKELAPKLADMKVYGDFGRNRGLATAIQRGVYEAMARVLANPELALPDNDQPVAEGGDPIRQPIYLDTITLPTLPVQGAAIFRPLSHGQTVEVRVRIAGSGGDRVRQREVYEAFRSALREVAFPPEIWDVMGGEGEAPRLFSSVEEQSLRQETESWQYIDANRVDPLTGAVRAAVDRRTLPVQVATFACKLAEGGAAQ